MDSKSPDLMQMLTSDMRYQAQRQKVLAQNVANVDTPGYKASDLKKADFSKLVEGSQPGATLAMAETSPKHLSGSLGGSSAFKAAEIKDNFEVKPTGNDVVLDDEMAKISETGTQYDLASTLYKKFTGLYRDAQGKN